MGKGDQRTRRGKVNRSSYGKTRPHKKKHEQHGSRTQAAKPRTIERRPAS